MTTHMTNCDDNDLCLIISVHDCIRKIFDNTTPKVVSRSGTAWQMLRDYSRSDASRPTVEPDRRAYGEVRGVLNQYLSHLLGRRPRMHEYLGILAS